MTVSVVILLKYANKARSTYTMQPKKPLAIFLCVSGACLFFTLVGILFMTLWATLYEAILKSQLTLTPNSNAFSLWVKNPVPLTLTLYMFNWTNPHDIYNKSIKPRFEQIGPYVYEEEKLKSDIIWNENDTVSYKNLKHWWYVPEKSKGSPYDPFTTINPIALSAAHSVRHWHMLIKKGFAFSLRALVSQIWTTHSVTEVLFDGYEDPLLAMATKMSFLPKSAVMDKFGWFYGRNGSSDFEGVFNMDTGTGGGQLGELRSWKYAEHTGYYPDHCGEFKQASAGDFFPRSLTKQSVVKMFSSDLCRYMDLEYEKEVVIHGIIGYKYAAGQKFLDNGTNIPENKCFCDGDCMPSGALNVSNCRHGSPAFVSLPHFYKADPYYTSVIDGVIPNETTDDFFMVFEPNTGIPLQVSARLQLNLRMEAVEGVGLFENVPTVFFPVLYFEQSVLLPENMVFLIKILINFKVICTSIGIFFICLPVLIFICVFYKMWNRKVFSRSRTTIKPKEEVPLNQ
uniref:Protein peste-like isoform X1 n=2 Tax=Diabrotica virgifera virgifera TaxID=50390 RepID=A0A6P7FA51_DIAVI